MAADGPLLWGACNLKIGQRETVEEGGRDEVKGNAELDWLKRRGYPVDSVLFPSPLHCWFTSEPQSSSCFRLQQSCLLCISLQEGSYLLAHAAGDSSVTIYKSCRDKTTRASYNLHTAHSDLPGVPSTLSVPWVPLDPNIPLPYHFAQQRVPCTFPPKPMDYVKKQKVRWISKWSASACSLLILKLFSFDPWGLENWMGLALFGVCLVWGFPLETLVLETGELYRTSPW